MTHSTKQPHPQPGPSAEVVSRGRWFRFRAQASGNASGARPFPAAGSYRNRRHHHHRPAYHGRLGNPAAGSLAHFDGNGPLSDPPPPSLWKASGPPFQPFSNLPGPLRQLHQAPDFDQLRDVRTSRDRAPIKSPEIAPSSRGSTSTRLGSRHTRHPQPPAGSGNPSHGKRDSGFSR